MHPLEGIKNVATWLFIRVLLSAIQKTQLNAYFGQGGFYCYSFWAEISLRCTDQCENNKKLIDQHE